MLLLLIVRQIAFAQQLPQYTQYILNNYLLNPAVSGIENYTDIKISHRHQWAGIQDAPVTTYFTIHGPLGKKDVILRHHVECSPCFLRKCPIDFRCMNAVTVNEVTQAISLLLRSGR